MLNKSPSVLQIAVFFVALAAPSVGVLADNTQHTMSETQQGGWSMADEHWDPGEMAKARAAEKKSHGASKVLFLQSDRFEVQTGNGNAHLLWDVQGWYGGDRHKLWVKSEGEYEFDEDKIEEAEVQALWSYALRPFFDLQTGIRHDFAPGRDRTFGVIGVQGLAPYWFEIDAAAFVSGRGDVSARLEAEYEILLTQRLILQPRTELNFALQDVPENEVGSDCHPLKSGRGLGMKSNANSRPISVSI